MRRVTIIHYVKASVIAVLMLAGIRFLRLGVKDWGVFLVFAAGFYIIYSAVKADALHKEVAYLRSLVFDEAELDEARTDSLRFRIIKAYLLKGFLHKGVSLPRMQRIMNIISARLNISRRGVSAEDDIHFASFGAAYPPEEITIKVRKGKVSRISGKNIVDDLDREAIRASNARKRARG